MRCRSSICAADRRDRVVAGTFFFIDPKDDIFAIYMMQAPSQRGRIQTALKTLIYEALEK